MNKENMTQFFSLILQKLKSALAVAGNFIKKHKIFSASMAVLLVIVSAVSFWVLDKLDRINYDDGSNPSLMYSETAHSGSELSSQATAAVTVPATAFNTADGSIVFLNGSYVNSMGAAVLSDGTTIYPTGIIVFQDGGYFEGTGIQVGRDGLLSLKNGKKVHVSECLVQKDGKVLMNKNGSLTELINVMPMLGNSNSDSGNPYGSNGGSSSNNSVTPQPVTTPEDDEELADIDFDQALQDAINDNVEIKEEIQQNDKLIEENSRNNEIWYSKDVMNILLMGIDYGGRNYPFGRSDAMIVVSINKNTRSVKLVSLARVSYVAIEGYNNTRLSHAHGYGGAKLAKETVEKNFKIKIDNYISTTFDSFQEVIDAFGGVDIPLTQAEVDDETMQYVLKRQGYNPVEAGIYTLDGYSALNYARLRSIDTDRQRTSRQRNILTALANQAKSMSIFQLNALLNRILPLVTTDLSKSEIVSQVMNVPSYLSNPIEQDVLPQKYSSTQTIDNFDVAFIDWNSEIAYAHQLFYSGTDVEYMTGS